MRILDTQEAIYERVYNRPTETELKREYYPYGEIGKDVVNTVNYFDDLDSHDPNAREKINAFYKYIKSITPYYCTTEKGVQLLRNLSEEKKWIEFKFSDNSIINEKPLFHYDGHSTNLKLDKYNYAEDILNEIVYQTRVMLSGADHNYNNLLNWKLVNRCPDASEFIFRLANRLNIKAKIIKISAGYSADELLYDLDVEYHFFVIATIDNENYLIDCSYSQFFSWYRNHIDRLGNYGYSGCLPGVYMLKDIEREKVARTILRNGWIKLDETTLKHYLDGFTLYYRNGLYYENLGEANYNVDYNIDTYINFLFGDDSQIKHENRKYLGYQLKPLRKSDFKF